MSGISYITAMGVFSLTCSRVSRIFLELVRNCDNKVFKIKKILFVEMRTSWVSKKDP